MDLSAALAPTDLGKLQKEIDVFNKSLGGQRTAKNVLDKDDFLQILLTQLTHQDPTQPLEDKEFIAQMAQFSTLEQMMGIGEDMSRMSGLLSRNQAYALLGKVVTIANGNDQVTGRVEEVSGGDFPRILVDGTYYNFSDVDAIRNEQEAGL